MATKFEDQILDATVNGVLMGTCDANQQIIEEILNEAISKVAEDAEDEQRGSSQLLRTEAEHWSHGKKKEVLTSSHRGQVLFHPYNVIEYQISHTSQICEIKNISHISDL